jgi:hypothetical protein
MCIRFRSRIQPRSLMRYASWLQADFQLSLGTLPVSGFVKWHYKCWTCCMPCSGRWPQLFPEAASFLCNCPEQDIENVGRVPVMGDGDSKGLPCSGSFKHYNCRAVSAFFARFAVVDILTDLVLAMRTRRTRGLKGPWMDSQKYWLQQNSSARIPFLRMSQHMAAIEAWFQMANHSTTEQAELSPLGWLWCFDQKGLCTDRTNHTNHTNSVISIDVFDCVRIFNTYYDNTLSAVCVWVCLSWTFVS